MGIEILEVWSTLHSAFKSLKGSQKIITAKFLLVKQLFLNLILFSYTTYLIFRRLQVFRVKLKTKIIASTGAVGERKEGGGGANKKHREMGLFQDVIISALVKTFIFYALYVFSEIISIFVIILNRSLFPFSYKTRLFIWECKLCSFLYEFQIFITYLLQLVKIFMNKKNGAST